MLAPGMDLPWVVGATAAKQNAADLKTYGWELELNWRDRINKDWSYRIGFNLYDSQSEITKYNNETNLLGDKIYRKGMKMGEIWGYVTDRFYTEDDFNADGTLKKEAFSEQGEHFVFHPDTKVKFSGYNIGGGNLTRIKETVLKMHANLPYLGILSWDLSLDTEGAVVLIEVNTTGQSAWFCQMVNGESLFGENTGKMLQLIRK